MDLPISRASAYLKRNRTTHSWYGDWASTNELMSRSCPNARTLEEHMRNARAAHFRSMTSSLHAARGRSRASDPPSTFRRRPSADRGSRERGGSAGYVPSSSSSSPGPTTAIRIPRSASRGRGGSMEKNRPSSAYSYDGGFFVTANNADKDFFVIDPEWVSEVDTVKKLSGEPGSKPPKVITWKSYRRSKSAPPPKPFNNPITWQL